jgi:hypothetical protein
MVGYGSCSGYDTLEAIRDMTPWDAKEASDEQAHDYYKLALDVASGMRKVDS